MKNWICWSLCLGLVAANVILAAGCSQPTSSQETNAAASPTAESGAAESQAAAVQDAGLENPAEESDLANAEVTPISAAKPVLPNLKLSGPAAEVVKLAESGAEESVMLAFVSNSVALFNLGADEIIYLNDIGVPSLVVAAMIQRDQALKELSASAAPGPAAPPPEDPGLYAPQPAEIPAATETVPEEAPPPAEAVSYPVFYDSLAPYGTWVDVAGVGACWQPTVVIVNPAWRPYCDGGRWIYSDCGWYWHSSYTWGWAPFHYGRWFRHHRVGWCWAPDTVWGPSWVSWRYNEAYCGWAPLPPRASFTHGRGLAYCGRPVGSSFGFGLGAGSYAFVENSRFRDRHLNRHALPSDHAARIFKQAPPSTSIVENNGRVINHGVPASRIAQATRTEVQRVTIRPVNNPPGRSARAERFEGNGRTLSVFRPEFPATAGTGRGPGGRPSAELVRGGSGLAPSAGGQPVIPARRPQGGGSTLSAEPRVSTPSPIASPRSSAFSSRPASPSSVPAPSVSSPSQATAPEPAQPLNVQRPDQPNRGTPASSVGAVKRESPRQTTTFIGKKEVRPAPPAGGAAVRSAPQAPVAAPVSPAPARVPRSVSAPALAAPRIAPSPAPTPARSMPTPSLAPEGRTPAPSFTPAPARSISPRTVSPAARTPAMESRPTRSALSSSFTPAPTRSFSQPSTPSSRQAPAMESRPTRSAPSPSFTPAPTRSFSQPSTPSGQRTPMMQSQPSRPAPSAPAASAPVRQDRPSSDRRGR